MKASDRRAARGQSTMEYVLIVCAIVGVCFVQVRGMPVYTLVWQSFVQFASGLIWYYSLPVT